MHSNLNNNSNYFKAILLGGRILFEKKIRQRCTACKHNLYNSEQIHQCIERDMLTFVYNFGTKRFQIDAIDGAGEPPLER